MGVCHHTVVSSARREYKQKTKLRTSYRTASSVYQVSNGDYRNIFTFRGRPIPMCRTRARIRAVTHRTDHARGCHSDSHHTIEKIARSHSARSPQPSQPRLLQARQRPLTVHSRLRFLYPFNLLKADSSPRSAKVRKIYYCCYPSEQTRD